jgi:VIT1/CCC1 family predicted Fe2+/Mn2+ transporter
LVALFLVGLINAHFLGVPKLKKAMEMLLVGGLAVVAGIIVGNIVNSLQ